MIDFQPKYWGFIKDPLYGYIHISEGERKIIDTRAFQRLHRIKQLPLAEIVYPAAMHTRFEHSLGVMHLASLYLASLPIEVSKEEFAEIRLASLLHDIGHGPFSHTFEPILMENFNMNHEQVGKYIVIKSEVSDKLKDEGIDPNKIGDIITGESKSVKKYLGQIIKSGLDSDKLDFIKRDNFHSGAGYGNIDIERLVTTIEIWNEELAVNMTALYTLELFILSRIKSFEAIYFHKTLRAAQILLLKALRSTIEEFGLFNKLDIDEYLGFDDFKIWYMLSKSKEGSKFLNRIENRDLIKSAFEVKIIGDIRQENLDKILKEIKSEISRASDVNQEYIEFDLSILPSVPYHNAYAQDPYEIPIVKIEEEKKVYKLSEVSSWIKELKPKINIFRIYTENEYRFKVAEASKKVLNKYNLFEESIY